MPSLLYLAASVCLVWSLVVWIVKFIGIRTIFRHYSSRPFSPVSPNLSNPQDAPHVTIIRPVKGLEPHLYECLASSFQQHYPPSRLSIRLCVESKSDEAYPLLCRLVEEHPNLDAKVLIEAEDPLLQGSGGLAQAMGPNPKIRNISRAFREAGADDVVWISDSNVHVAKNALGRMVDKLEGFTADGRKSATPFRLVHLIPLVVDTINYSQTIDSASALPLSRPRSGSEVAEKSLFSRIKAQGGGRLDEMFMATTHAKFYAAINAVAVAPCVVGKSNMFRKSHLNLATRPSSGSNLLAGGETPLIGSDFFSRFICEDHLISEALWKAHIPGFAKTAIGWGDLAVQPTANMSVAAYTGRRVRWLRARKFTVLAATLVEPGIESLVCSAYLAFALTTLPWFQENLGIPHTYSAMVSVWLASVAAWAFEDWLFFSRLHSGRSAELEDDTPFFARGTTNAGGVPQRSLVSWLLAWLGREVMALPIWTWAVMLGMDVNWRGKRFKVGWDMTVREAVGRERSRDSAVSESGRSRPSSKDRQD
ncbi:glycosyltransferase family 21 protein [Stachybotrys elegans]|uniref:Ceramide glucosyltransferase n=1 Tax=Stachybotrys elegans TaxID=80388 RepID=A0A8K0SUG2_9HYPO|nr:glycosyltransferase family 21 protein [Stachybotrys elegans]